MSRPIQPSLRLDLARAMALADPRCGHELHNEIGTHKHYVCPYCFLQLSDYLAVVGEYWPSPGVMTPGAGVTRG